MRDLKQSALFMALSGCVIMALGAQAADTDPALLVGVRKCRMCHKKDDVGNQHGKWQEGPHAKAFEELAGENAKAVATKLGIDNP